MTNTEVCGLDGKPRPCFYPHDHLCNHQVTKSFPIYSTGVYKPLPQCVFSSLWSVEEGERCIDRTSCTSGVQWEGYSNPFLVFPSNVHLSVWSSESVGVFTHVPPRGEPPEQPLWLQIEGELPLLAQALAADLHGEPAHPGAAAVQAEVTANVAKLGVGLNLLPFLVAHKKTTRCSVFQALQVFVRLLQLLQRSHRAPVPVCCRSLDSLVVWWGNRLSCPPPSGTGPCVWLTYPWSGPIPETNKEAKH